MIASTARTYIYFFRPVGLPGPIKIGCSKAPQKRLLDFARWSPFPLELIVTIPGNEKLEYNLHDCFFSAHSHLEWFHATPELLAFLEALKAGTPVERAINLSARGGSIKAKKLRARGAWSPGRRRYMGWVLKAWSALRRVERVRGEQMWKPEWIDDAIAAVRRGQETSDHIAALEKFVTDPAAHCLSRKERWPAPTIVSGVAA